MKKTTQRFHILLALLATTVANSAPLYKVVNENGSVTYTDTYQPDAKEVDLTSINSAVMPAIPTPSNQQKRMIKEFPVYELTFISPEDKQTIRNNLGIMTISASLRSAANLTATPSGKFQLIIDGKPEQSNAVPTFTVKNLDRGEHSVQIKLIHQTGKILASTETRVFYLKQASRLINPN